MAPLRTFLFLVIASLCLASPILANPPILVAEFDFEAPGGGPDAQGWRPLQYYESENTHFHVEEFTGAGHEATPLAGQQSMWCGANAEDPETCHWGAPPGYGANWNENLVSQPFPVVGDVSIGFLAQFGMEEGYDFVHLAYEDTAGAWVRLESWDCGFYEDCGAESWSFTVPADAHDGSLRFRFHFTSDGIVDSETAFFGSLPVAFVLDSLTVADAGGVVDYQDFESEALGDSVTADGHWYAEPNTDAYNGGLLVEGGTVLQETLNMNDSWFWAFYGDSDRDYSCAGFPAQLVVPESQSLIRSPVIDLTREPDGSPVVGEADSIRISFDIYRDIAPDEQKAWFWYARLYVDDCLARYEKSPLLPKESLKDWVRHEVVLVPPVGTTTMELNLGVQNFQFEAGQCRSHAPLFDNVTIERFGGGVSAVEETPAPVRQMVLSSSPNPFNPVTTIRYDLPEAGLMSLKIYDVAGRLVRTLEDQVMRPVGPGEAVWRGVDDGGRAVASGTYFCRLTAGDAAVITTMALVR